MIDAETLTRWQEWSKRDDWHQLFVGSDIRTMLGEIVRLTPIDAATSIEHNQIVTPAQKPEGDDRAMETVDGADEIESLGPAVTFPTYRKPADPRVQNLLKEAARDRAVATPAEPAKIYRDPRLDPNYKPPRRPPPSR